MNPNSMKDIEYEAEIVGLEEASKTMYVKYTSPGRRELIAAARLPETEDQTAYEIHVAAPFGLWLEDERSVFVPEVGHKMKGVIKLAPPEQELPAVPYAAPEVSTLPLPGQAISQPHADSTQEGAASPQGFPTRYVPGSFSRPASNGGGEPPLVL